MRMLRQKIHRIRSKSGEERRRDFTKDETTYQIREATGIMEIQFGDDSEVLTSLSFLKKKLPKCEI